MCLQTAFVWMTEELAGNWLDLLFHGNSCGRGWYRKVWAGWSQVWSWSELFASVRLDMNLRSSVIVKFIRPSIAHAVSRTNKIMVKYKSRNKLILKNSKRKVEHVLFGLYLFSWTCGLYSHRTVLKKSFKYTGWP